MDKAKLSALPRRVPIDFRGMSAQHLASRLAYHGVNLCGKDLSTVIYVHLGYVKTLKDIARVVSDHDPEELVRYLVRQKVMKPGKIELTAKGNLIADLALLEYNNVVESWIRDPFFVSLAEASGSFNLNDESLDEYISRTLRGE
jgi:hypothetical protein